MNKTRILLLADAIEQHQISWLGFSMSHVWGDAWEESPDQSGHDCKTVACIAGWACAVFDPEDKLGKYPTSDKAEEILEISGEEGLRLFFPSLSVPYKEVLPAEAVSVLRNFAETGRVDW